MEPMEAGATAAEAAARHRTLPALRTFTVGRTPMEVAATLNMFPTAESTYQTRRGGLRRRYSREVRSALGVALLAPTLVGMTFEYGERAVPRLPSTHGFRFYRGKAPNQIEKSRKIDSRIDRLAAATAEISAPKLRIRGRKIALWRNRESSSLVGTVSASKRADWFPRERQTRRLLSDTPSVRDVQKRERSSVILYVRRLTITPPRPCPL